MKLLVHDLDEPDFRLLGLKIAEDTVVIANDHEIRSCVGCFGCWIKTPAACVIRDHFGDMGALLARCDSLTIISRCFYGGYSPFVKNVLDRSISYIHPYFSIRNGEMHHRSRYENRLRLAVFFYGPDITPDEQSTAMKLVSANGLNLNTRENSVRFIADLREMEGQTV